MSDWKPKFGDMIVFADGSAHMFITRGGSKKMTLMDTMIPEPSPFAYVGKVEGGWTQEYLKPPDGRYYRWHRE